MNAFVEKAKRYLSRGVAKSILPSPKTSIVTFGFDDCPASAIENALPKLEKLDWRATIYVACGLCETENHLGLHMSLADITDVHARGHEIADHTFSHISPNDVAPESYRADIEKNQETLKQIGVPASRHFAYPYGHVTPALKKSLSGRFETLRGVINYNHNQQDGNLMNATRVYSGPDLEAASHAIETAKTSPQWLNLFTHDVRENPSDYGCTPAEFQHVVDSVKRSGLRVMTVDAAYRTLMAEGQAA